MHDDGIDPQQLEQDDVLGEAVLEQARRADGDLYGLVNVAGGAAPATWMPSTRVTRADWRALMTANLETMFFMSQAVAAELRSRGRPGSIVSIFDTDTTGSSLPVANIAKVSTSA